MQQFAHIPMSFIGPLKVTGPVMQDEVMVPLATYESPLWPSTNRGAKVSVLAHGIQAVVRDDRMTRSILVEADNAVEALMALQSIQAQLSQLQAIVANQSRFTRLLDMHFQQAANLLFVRFEFSTGDASGHNMATQAAQALLDFILNTYPTLKYVSISGNFCTDKKATSVNGILGRGKYVVADILIPRDVCMHVLKTTPEQIVNLNIKKNLIGTMLAGGVRSANAHFANMLLGLYLATGQDAANIIEGSQGFVQAEVRDGHLYFAVTLPNVIVGTIGNGKDLEFVRENLKILGCLESRNPGDNAKRLAVITAATVLCGELSLLAAQTNNGELMESHVKYERQKESTVRPLECV